MQCNGDRLFHFPNITSQLISLFLLLGLLMKNLWRSCFAFTSSSLIGTSNSLLLCILGLTIILYLSDTWSWSWSGPSSKRGQFFLMITMVTINFKYIFLCIEMIYVSLCNLHLLHDWGESGSAPYSTSFLFGFIAIWQENPSTISLTLWNSCTTILADTFLDGTFTVSTTKYATMSASFF